MPEQEGEQSLEAEIVMQPDFNKFLDSLSQNQLVFLSLLWSTSGATPEDVMSAQMCYSLTGRLLTVRLQKLMEPEGERPLIDSMMEEFFVPVTAEELRVVDEESEDKLIA